MRPIPTTKDESARIGRRLHKAIAAVVIASYLGVSLWYLARQALGDWSSDPVGYYFTWDMFPFALRQSTRRVAIGRTQSGQRLQVHPAPFHRYRGGLHGVMPRVDLERSGMYYRSVCEQAVRLTRESQAPDPLVDVTLFEEYWPDKFNLPDDVYEAWAGEAKQFHPAWRIVGEWRPADDRGKQPATDGPATRAPAEGSP